MTFSQTFRQTGSKSLLSLALVLVTATLSGCSMGTIDQSGSIPAGPAQGPLLTGSVHGGQQQIVGSKIQLYAAGTSGTSSSTNGGYGFGATALIPSGSYYPGGAPGCVASAVQTCTTFPTTDSQGSFTITNDYSCPSATSQVYLVATGGNPGNASGNVNPYITLMAALGPCTSTNTAGQPALPATSFIYLNEVTTVASAYALAQFLSPPSGSGVLGVGAPSTVYSGVANGVVGMTNAFSWVNTLANIATGTSPGTNPYAVVESNQLNTVADILAPCINSDPTTSTMCNTLMTDATPAGATTATDTLQALYYIVRNPYNTPANPTYVSTLYALASSTAPYVGESAAPTDFTLNVQLAPYFLSQATSPASNQPAIGVPLSIAFDQYGNAWVVNFGQSVTSTIPAGTANLSASVTEIGPTGTVLAGPTAVFTALTTDGSGTAYGAYGEFTQAPTTNTRSFTFATGNTSSEGVVAIDLMNNAWVSNSRDIVMGTLANPTTDTGGTVAVFPGSTAVNAANNGTAFGYYTAYQPDGIAVDAKNNVFIATTSGSPLISYDSIGEFPGGVPSVGGTFIFSDPSPNNVVPYKLPGGLTKLAIDANTTATNGPFLWTANQTACNSGALPGVLGSFNQYLTGNLQPSANSPFASSSAVCPSSNGIKTTFAAATTEPAFVAIDKSNGVLVTDEYFSATSGFDGLTYLQTDANGNVTNSVTYAATAAGTKGAAGAALSDPAGIAVDGNNNVFIGNIGTSVGLIAEFTLNPTTPSLTFNQLIKGYSHQYSSPAYIAIDSSGNLWAANEAKIAQNGLPIGGMNRASTLSVTIGAVGPVVTPLAAAVKGNRIGQKP